MLIVNYLIYDLNGLIGFNTNLNLITIYHSNKILFRFRLNIVGFGLKKSGKWKEVVGLHINIINFTTSPWHT